MWKDIINGHSPLSYAIAWGVSSGIQDTMSKIDSVQAEHVRGGVWNMDIVYASHTVVNYGNVTCQCSDADIGHKIVSFDLNNRFNFLTLKWSCGQANKISL